MYVVEHDEDNAVDTCSDGASDSDADGDTEIVTSFASDPTSVATFSLGEYVEGQRIHTELHIDGGRSYYRWIVRCPHASSTHLCTKMCKKRRNAGHEQTRHFGDKELYGYLGCWIKAAPKYTSASAHKRFRPTVAQIRKYIEEQGW